MMPERRLDKKEREKLTYDIQHSPIPFALGEVGMGLGTERCITELCQ